MKLRHTYWLAGALLVLGGTANAQQSSEDELREQREEYEMRMREAEQQMAEAAQRIAELSSAQLARAGEMQRQWTISVNRPMLGITIGANSDADSIPVEGSTISGVTPGGAADEAGLRAGDVITGINGDSMTSDNGMDANRKLLDFMAGVEEGDILDVDYLRNGSVGKVEVRPRVMDGTIFNFPFRRGNMAVPVAPMAPSAPNTVAFRFFGNHGLGELEMVSLTESLGRYFGTDSGLLIVRAPSDNVFELQDGDVITNIDGREPKNLHHAVRILSSYEAGETVNIDIMRDKRKQTLTIIVPDNRSSQLFGHHRAVPASS